MSNLQDRALHCILVKTPHEKVGLTRALAADWHRGGLPLLGGGIAVAIPVPGRPDRPALVPPQAVPKRSINTPEGHGALVHAIAHIEFNAINLALDAVYRFRGMPREYYDDWLKVAAEEALHFELLCGRLTEMGFAYGDFAAHDGLWDMARDTAYDVLVRMALVPRVLEARGLDATPRIIRRLRAIPDEETISILDKYIFPDEVGHVAIGTRWFRFCCDQRGLDSESEFARLLDTAMRGQLRGPLHVDARRRAGFTTKELERLERSLQRNSG